MQVPTCRFVLSQFVMHVTAEMYMYKNQNSLKYRSDWKKITSVVYVFVSYKMFSIWVALLHSRNRIYIIYFHDQTIITSFFFSFFFLEGEGLK